MSAPRPKLQMVAEKTDTDTVSNRPTPSGATGQATAAAAAAVCDLFKDMEGQPAEAVGTLNPGTAPIKMMPEAPGMDDNEAHISISTFLRIVTALSALYMAANPWLFFYDADKGEICPYTVICATNPVEMTLLTGSRLSAGVLFSSLTVSIFSKCYATRSFLHHSWLGAVIDFEPSHDLHTYFGYLSMVAALEHGLLHCLRFAHAKQQYLIYETDTGRSGVIGCLLLLPIVLPMRFEFFRTKMSFQFRKGLHLLFLPLLVALCFHSVIFRYVGSILIVWYVLDRFYFTTRQTFLIDHPVFEAVGRGTMVVLDLPAGYTFKAGSYIYVNSPMISRSEWHPFSIIQVPGTAPRAAFYAEAVGDWTQELFRLGLEQPRLPLWITAAQPSIMEKSIYFDNVVLVCTGAGITPAVSIIERFAKRKNIHLVWMSRDGGMVALFEEQLRKVKSTVHLTGKPTEETKEALKRLLQPSLKNEVGAAGRMSFGSMVGNDLLKMMTPSATPMAKQGGANAGEETKAAHGDTGEISSFPPRHLNAPNMTGQSLNSTMRHRPSKLIGTRPANPVTLLFGRPDIAAYLTETFAKQTRAPRSGSRTGRDSFGRLNDTSVSVSDMKTAAGLPGVQKSKRLDADQKVLKETLMKADAGVVEACQQQQQRAAARNKAIPSNDITPGTSSNSLSPGCPLPWLVLYCGANPKVEEAIAKTCDELHVSWQKEYFGAW